MAVENACQIISVLVLVCYVFFVSSFQLLLLFEIDYVLIGGHKTSFGFHPNELE